jgi:hypothetical protein
MTCDGRVGVRDGPAAGGVGLVRGCGVRVGATVRSAGGRSGVTEKGVRVGLGVALGLVVEAGKDATDGASVAEGDGSTGLVTLWVGVEVDSAPKKGEELWSAGTTRVGAAGAQPGNVKTAVMANHNRARENTCMWTPEIQSMS